MHKLAGVQMIRAFAALLVLIGHVIAEAEYYFAVSMGLDFIPWTRGVDIFFVVSGFIITLSITRYSGRPVDFLKRRALRVLPLYYVFTTLMVLVLIFFPNGPKETQFDLGQILSSYGFFPYPRADGRIAPILSLGWTLNYEMFFYVLCAGSLLNRRPALVLSILIAAIVVLGTTNQFVAPHWIFWSNPIILEFLFGVLIAKIYQAGWKKPCLPIAIGVFIGGLCLLVSLQATGLPRFIAAGIPALLIVASGTLFYPPNLKGWQILGDASYALYLSHRFVLRVMTILLVPILPTSVFGVWGFVLCISTIAIAIAIVVHLWLEKPFLNPMQKRAFA